MRLVFLQSDAPRHLAPFGCWHRERGVADCIERARPFSFLSLAGQVVGAGYKSMIPLATYCALYRNFTIPSPPATTGAPCRAWNSATWAHFAVSRAAVRAHSRETYRRLLALFEDSEALTNATFRTAKVDVSCRTDATGLHCSDSKPHRWDVAGATFLERSWSFIFGCARALTTRNTSSAVAPEEECIYQPDDTHADLVSRCPSFNQMLRGSRLGPPPPASSRAKHEADSKLGCRSVEPFGASSAGVDDGGGARLGSRRVVGAGRSG